MTLNIVSLVSNRVNSNAKKAVNWKIVSYEDSDLRVTPKLIRQKPDQSGNFKNIFDWVNYLQREDVDDVIKLNGNYAMFSYTKSVEAMQQELLQAKSLMFSRRIASTKDDLKQLEDEKKLIDSNII